MKSALKILISIVALFSVGWYFVGAETSEAATNQTGSQSTGSTVISSAPVTPALSPAVRDLEIVPLENKLNREINPLKNPGLFQDDLGLTGTDTHKQDPLAQLSQINTGSTPGLLFDFEGLSSDGFTPPDTVGDVGPNHYIQMVNISFSIFDKTGTPIVNDVPFTSLFIGSGLTACTNENNGDPIVLYDSLADRWLLSQFAINSGERMCIAISQTPDPTGAYYLYQFDMPDFPDYFKFGVWEDAYYMGTNTGFPNQYYAYAFDRANMLAGNPATFQFANGIANFLMPADIDGPTPAPAGTPGMFYTMYSDGYPNHPAGVDRLALYEFDVDWVTPANSTFSLAQELPIAAYNYTVCGFFIQNCIPQPGTAQGLDSLSYWPMWRFAYRNFGTYQAMVGNFTVDLDGTDKAAIRWFELRDSGASWTLHQEGTHAPDSDHRWMASIAMDGSGNIALGYTTSSATTIPTIRYATRLATDPLGTLQTEATMLASTGVHTGVARWGDYSSMNVDPTDECTFWYTNQYDTANNTGFSWQTRVGVFKIPECTGSSNSFTFGLNVQPAQQDICIGDDTTYEVTVNRFGGYSADVALNTVGTPSGYSSSFSPNPVVTGTLTSTMSLMDTGGATAGSYNIDVVGTGVPTPTVTQTVVLNLFDVIGSAPTLTTPPDGASGVSPSPTLEWNAVSGASSYLVEVATDAGFSNIVYSANVASSPHDIAGALTPLTTYYWHVRANNVCGDSAYSTAFSFTTADIPPVLLVDDDDNSPDVLSFYTTALDTLLGAGNYDIWDTGNTDNEPTAVDLAPYTTVIWFTGDEFGGFAGPGAAGETALGSWLNNGNCLFITSQDYHYDRGLTPFMTNYLGTTSVANDSGDYSSVTGQGLVFGGLGPYALNYGPVGTDYSDIIVPNGTAELSFVGNNSNGAAIDKDSGVYRTTFWAYSYEAIGGADDRLEAMQTVLNWCTPTGANIDFEKTVGTDPGACASNNVLDLPYGGGEVTYCYEVTNTGVVTLTEHDLVDSELGTLLSGFAHDLTPGSSVWITASTMITQTTVNLATWTAGDGVDTISRDSSATVNVAPPEPMIAVNPAAVTSAQAPDNQVGKTLTISNVGTGDLDWSIVELAPVVPPPTGAGPLSGSPERLGVAAPVESAIQPKAAAGGGVVADGSFEAGTPNPSWNEASTNFGTPLCTVAGCTTGTGTGPRTGSWWAWFGGIGAYEEGSVDQDVTIESGTATLSFYLEQIVCDSAADYLEVLIDGNQVFVSDGSSALCGVLGYSLQSVDISAYADGGTHNLAFHSEIFATNGGGSNFFVDDVTIDVIPGVSCSSPSDISWASVSPTSGTTTGGNASDMTVTFDSTGLVTGVYTATLCIESNDMAGNEVVSVPLTMTVETPSYGVGIDPEAALTGLAGATVTYTLYITNTGNTADTFDLAATGNSWTTTLSDSSVSLNVGESTMVWVTVDIPTGVADGDMDVATVTATSAGDSGVSASATLTTTAEVEGYFIYLPFVAKDA